MYAFYLTTFKYRQINLFLKQFFFILHILTANQVHGGKIINTQIQKLINFALLPGIKYRALLIVAATCTSKQLCMWQGKKKKFLKKKKTTFTQQHTRSHTNETRLQLLIV